MQMGMKLGQAQSILVAAQLSALLYKHLDVKA